MPTEITAQNGAVIKQNTKVAISGCKGVASYKTTRAQKLAKARKECRSKYKRKRRHKKLLACERSARKRYPAKANKHAHSARPRLSRSPWKFAVAVPV